MQTHAGTINTTFLSVNHHELCLVDSVDPILLMLSTPQNPIILPPHPLWSSRFDQYLSVSICSSQVLKEASLMMARPRHQSYEYRRISSEIILLNLENASI